MRWVHFIDTSILLCLLKVPNTCDDKYSEVIEELKNIIERGETLILSIASIIETGNHITQINDGNSRRAIALKFAQYLRDTADNQAPWSLTDLNWSPDKLRKFADDFPELATREVGFGDMSIIEAFNDYLERTPGVSARIWSKDGHLMAYQYEAPEIGRRSRGN